MSIRDYAPWKWGKKQNMPTRSGDWEPFDALHRQIGNLLEDFMSGFSMEPFSGSGNFVPKINVSEDEASLKITAELPGMEEKDVEVTLADNAVTIRGEKKIEHEEKSEGSRQYLERSYGYFQRTVPLQCEIDTDNVDAVFKKGVLSVTLTKSKAEQSKAKKISIRQQ